MHNNEQMIKPETGQQDGKPHLLLPLNRNSCIASLHLRFRKFNVHNFVLRKWLRIRNIRE